MTSLGSRVSMTMLHNRLKVEDASRCVAFYKEKFGMKLLSETKAGDNTVYMLGFRGQEGAKYDKDLCLLELTSPCKKPGQVSRLNHGERSGVYWKIAVNLADVDTAVSKLQANGVAMDTAGQFRDIGYLAHLQDTDSYSIELIGHLFDGKVAPHDKLAGHPLAQQPSLGLITLRSSHVQTDLKFYRDTLGMKLLVREDVAPYNFTLYFLAFTDEDPPVKNDIDAVENREWLYQRPYPVLEIQVMKDGAERKYKPMDENTFGFMGLGFGCSDLNTVRSHLQSQGVTIQEELATDPLFSAPSLTVTGPHDIPCRFVQYT